MHRNDLIIVIGLITAVIGCGLHNSIHAERKAEAKPNIIFILADDLGYGDLGCYGQDKIKTPCLDRMAAGGMRFTDHYAGSAVCAPSRCSLMTGQHTGHATIRENSYQPLNPDDVIIPQRLKQAGYTTGLVGKWGLGEAGTISMPDKVGFDYFYGLLNQGVAHFYYTPWVWINEKKVMIPENADGKQGVYIHDRFTEQACRFIRRNRDKPFFLYLAYAIPHAEMSVPEDSLKQYKGKFPERPKKAGGGGGGYGTGLPGYGAHETPNACYAAMITRMDRDVGRIAALLRKLEIEENTIVIFTSDNGPSGEGGNDISFFESNGSLRKQKASLYEGGIRVPLIIQWPKYIKSGSVSNHVCAFWDFMPTFTELAGVPNPRQSDGISLVPLLMAKSEKQPKHEFLYWELGRRKAQALRMGKWKGLFFHNEDRFELYNLEADIAEKQDVAAQKPETVSRMLNIMHEAHVPSPVFPLPRDTKYTASD